MSEPANQTSAPDQARRRRRTLLVVGGLLLVGLIAWHEHTLRRTPSALADCEGSCPGGKIGPGCPIDLKANSAAAVRMLQAEGCTCELGSCDPAQPE